MRTKVVVIGGNAAGMTAASRAKRLDPSLDIAILEASRFISYSICGLPFLVTGEVFRAEDLIAFDPERLSRERDIEARTGILVQEILPGRRILSWRDPQSGSHGEVPYDALVISTGYLPRPSGIEGADLENVFSVSRLEHGIGIRKALESGRAGRAAVIGGGYIGLMMAHALRTRGLEVVLIERNRHVLNQHLDDDLAQTLEEELSRNGVEVVLGTRAHRVTGPGIVDGVEFGGERRPVDLALIDVGVVPNTDLAERAGIPCGLSGGIEVDDRGQTSLGGVYAAGNCAQTTHLLTGQPLVSTLGTTAAKQGRVVGENLSGLRSHFPGTLETSLEKVFGLSVAHTGLTLRQALTSGFAAEAVTITASDRAGYYSGRQEMKVRLVFEKRSGRLLGGQILGGELAAKRIDTVVAALSAGMDLEQVSRLDLAYAPPYATLWDPIQVAAQQGLRRIRPG